MPLDGPAEPWLSFLTELDAQLDAPVDFHCIGGFVVSQHYGLGRETADLDVLAVIPREVAEQVVQLASVPIAKLLTIPQFWELCTCWSPSRRPVSSQV